MPVPVTRRPATRARLGAAVADEVLIGLATALLVAMAVQTGAVAVLATGVGAALGGLEPGGATAPGIVMGALWLAVRLAYGVAGEGGPAAATPGKRLAGLRVVGPDGEPCGYQRALVRQIAKTAMLASIAGVAVVLAGGRWHDAAAGTRVEAP